MQPCSSTSPCRVLDCAPMGTVYLVRHGETDWALVNGRRLIGAANDLAPLTSEGTSQILAAAERLRDERVGLLLASPMTRALQSAALLSRVLDVPLQVEFDLHECPRLVLPRPPLISVPIFLNPGNTLLPRRAEESAVRKRQVFPGVTAVALGALSAAGVAGTAYCQTVRQATTVLRDATDRVVGAAQFVETTAGVRITVQARGLPPGTHGIHIHDQGICEGPAFATASGHFNPTNKQHGFNNPQGPHAGDLVNLVVAADGSASYTTTNNMVTLAPGTTSVLKAGGASLMIHADPDDYVTDPAGNSGTRIACGTIVAGAAALPATGGSPMSFSGLASPLAVSRNRCSGSPPPRPSFLVSEAAAAGPRALPSTKVR